MSQTLNENLSASKRFPLDATTDASSIARFSHFVAIEVRYWETDSAQHVNHVALPAYLEHGLLKLLAEIGDPEPLSRFPFEHVTGELFVRYIAPSSFGETLRVGSRIERIGRSSAAIEQVIFGRDGCVRNVARTVIIRTQNGRSVPWSEGQRAALLAYGTEA